MQENKIKFNNDENDKKIMELNMEICKLKNELQLKDK